MTEIERVKAQIKVLQSKLSFLEELSQTKTPCEEAYKKVFGFYPMGRANGVWTISDEDTWIGFQNGYNAAQKDYKVGEHQEPEEEPEELKTLYQMLDDGYIPDRLDHICSIVKEWMSQYDCDYATCKEYLEGYEKCQTVLEERLK